MRRLCDKCFKFFDVEEEYVGYNVICPNCGEETMVKANERKASPKTTIKTAPVEPQVNTSLCFFLGFAFNIIGLLIAAIIGKQKGCMSGLWGMLAADIIGAVCWLFISLA